LQSWAWNPVSCIGKASAPPRSYIISPWFLKTGSH
jgi:hypothetical protein